MAMLKTANSTSNKPPIAGSWIPHPSSMHAPLISQRSASGIPISQKAHQRAIWPLMNFLRSVMGSARTWVQQEHGFKQEIAASDSAGHEELSADCMGPQFLPVLVAFGTVLRHI